jgi:hypothetical protein
LGIALSAKHLLVGDHDNPGFIEHHREWMIRAARSA